MKNTAKTPTTTEQSWQERAIEAEAQVRSLLQEMEYLKAQMRLLTAKRYGASSEKSKQNINQLSLFDSAFNEAEASAEPFAPEPELVTVPAHKRKKSKKEDRSWRACRRTLSNTIFLKKRWYVLAAAIKGTLFARKSPESSLSYLRSFPLTSTSRMYVDADIVRPMVAVVNLLLLQHLSPIELFQVALLPLR